MIESVLFTKTQTRLLNEMKVKYERSWRIELNTILADIYDELGLSDKAMDSKYRLELQPGFTGVNIKDQDDKPKS